MVVTRSMSKTDTMVTSSVSKTDPKIAKSYWKLDSKNAKRIGETSSGETTGKTNSIIIDIDAMNLFIKNVYLKRYYEEHPPCTTRLIPKEVNRAGQLEWLSLSDSEKASWIALVEKTYKTRSVPKIDTIVTRSVPKTDPKIAEQTEKDKIAKSYWKLDSKNAKIIGETSSGETTGKTNSIIIDIDAMNLFIKNVYLKRYYEEHPPCTTRLIPKEVNRAGQLEWLSLSDSEKASWIALVQKTYKTRSVPKTDTVVTRSVPKTDPKSAKIIGVTSSGELIWKENLTIETEAMILFMKNDYLKRYYEKHPPCTTRLIPKEVDHAGQLEWLSLSASAKASWIALV